MAEKLEKQEKQVKELQLIVTKVQIVEDSQQRGYCKKIVLATDNGRITFSPKAFVTESRVLPSGMEITRDDKKLMLFEELPEILQKINDVVSNKKSCTIKAKVTEWNTIDRKGEPVTYTFFASMDDFKAVEIL